MSDQKQNNGPYKRRRRPQAAGRADAAKTPQNGGVSAQPSAEEAQQPAVHKSRGRPKKAAAAADVRGEAAAGGSAKKNRDKTQGGSAVRIIPLGGINEIGKNMTVFECEGDILIVDCGLAFPDDDMMGVDIVIPDFSYIEKNASKVRGIVVTHGHEDHIGSIPYLLKSKDMPVYGTRLTLGLIEGKLKEHGLIGKAKLNVVNVGQTVKMGCMSVEFIRVNHSIPDSCALAISTPAGLIIQTSDFKVDYTPIEGSIIDLARFGELGSHGVLALLSDSTNAERPGTSMSERKVGESLDSLFKSADDKRIIIATFASNVHRVQQIVEVSEKYKRKIAVSGRSMVNVVSKAIELGYLKVPGGMLIDIDTIDRYPPNGLVIITTGSQGEPMSALTRMAMGDHRKVSVSPGDFIIISANPIPGNEKTVSRIVNELLKLGAEVIYEKMYEVHVSGHACQDELKLMIGLTKPKFFIPVHGEYKQLKKHAKLAVSMGIDQRNVFISEIGRVLETNGETMKFTGQVPSGRVFVDGSGVGDVGSIVLRDRRHLGQDGLIVLVVAIDSQTGNLSAGPDIVSRGFVYVRESEGMMKEACTIARSVFEDCTQSGVREWGTVKQQVKDALNQYFYSKTKRNPMILPIIQEV